MAFILCLERSICDRTNYDKLFCVICARVYFKQKPSWNNLSILLFPFIILTLALTNTKFPSHFTWNVQPLLGLQKDKK